MVGFFGSVQDGMIASSSSSYHAKSSGSHCFSSTIRLCLVLVFSTVLFLVSRALICLDFPGLIKHPIARPTGQSRHYTIQPCSTLWRTKGNGAMRSHGAISWLRKRREINKSVQYERHDITVRHAMVSRHSRHASLAYTGEVFRLSAGANKPFNIFSGFDKSNYDIDIFRRECMRSILEWSVEVADSLIPVFSFSGFSNVTAAFPCAQICIYRPPTKIYSDVSAIKRQSGFQNNAASRESRVITRVSRVTILFL
jgi:hypothetical protein